MSDLDYETLFNDMAVQTREKRKHLKEVLDRVFEDDSGRTAEVLAEMLRVNEKAQALESARPQFMSVMNAMRSVKGVREELLQKVDRLMDEIRRFLALKEELASERLDRLTTLFREELGNPQFKFHFHLMDDQELHHLSEVRSLARREPVGEAPRESAPLREMVREAPAAPPPAPPPPPPPAPRVTARATPPPPPPPPVREPDPEPETLPSSGWQGARIEVPEEPAWTPVAEERPSWLNQTAPEPTLKGQAPEPEYLQEEEAPAAQPQAEPEQQGGNPYEVDVDVLRILSEETFRPPKR